MIYSSIYKPFLLKLTISILLFVGATHFVFSQDIDEYDTKSGYIFNIIKNVNWKDSSVIMRYTIGVYGSDDFAKILESRAKEQNQNGNRKYIVKRFKTAAEIENCHLIMLVSCSASQMLLIVNTLKDKQILTMANNQPNFCEVGGILNFKPIDSDKFLEINSDAALLEHIIIKPEILQLSVIKTTKR